MWISPQSEADESSLSEEFYDIISLKQGVWQYLLDHAKGNIDGGFRVFLFLPPEKEFWRRVYARKTGKYKRNDLSKLHQESQNKYSEYMIMKKLKQKADTREGRINSWRSGNFKERVKWQVVINLRKLINRLVSTAD